MSYILGLETSCDETAAAVLDLNGVVQANIIATQIDTHKDYGGVIPEIASRMHVEAVNAVVEQALQKSGKTMADISAVAATQGPGLLGALLIGLQVAKTLCYIHKKPLIAVQHLEGHIFANFISADKNYRQNIPYPFLCLIVSGGHTQIVISPQPGVYQTIGRTIDDAAGEAYDKVARILQLGYPGGPIVDKMAQAVSSTSLLLRRGKSTDRSSASDSNVIKFSKAKIRNPAREFDFSFSGLKTQVLNYARQNPDARAEDVCAAFQKTVVDTLVENTLSAARKHNINNIYLAGGVSANQSLRQTLTEAAQAAGRTAHIPELVFCTDNAAMIAGAAIRKLQNQEFSKLNIQAKPNWEL